MKPRFYLLILLLIVPVQASLFNPLSLAGVKPDLGLIAVYIIGLLTGPGEATLIGMALGVIQDIGSSGLLGLTGFTQGVVGLLAGMLGRRVLDIASPSNIIFLAVFSFIESVLIALFMQVHYGDVPFFSMVLTRMLPGALYTGMLGTLLLRIINNRSVLTALMRRGIQKEL